jgi:hypothetical protein
VRLWVDGKPVVDNWTDHAATNDSGQVTLTAGQKYDLKLEFYENLGAAVMRLDWKVPGELQTLIPTEQLFWGSSVCVPSCAGKQCGTDGCGGSCGVCSSGPSDPRWFRLAAEITGSNPAPWAQVLADGLKFNGFGMWVPVPASAKTFIQNSTHSLMAYMPASNRNMPAYHYTYDPAKTQTLEATLRSMASSDPSKIYWDGMPEFDQGGGDWSQGRPAPSASLTRQQKLRAVP